MKYSHRTQNRPATARIFATILRQHLLAGLLGARRRHFLGLQQKSAPLQVGFECDTYNIAFMIFGRLRIIFY